MTEKDGMLTDERLNIRRGMRMVLEDRLKQSEKINDLFPLFDTLDFINEKYKDQGFSVSFLLHGYVIIDGILYTDNDNLVVVHEDGIALFIIYRHKHSGEMMIDANEIHFLEDREKQFYLMIDHILKTAPLDDLSNVDQDVL